MRAAELRVSPDAGKCGKGYAQQTTDSVGPAEVGKRDDGAHEEDNDAAPLKFLETAAPAQKLNPSW